MLGAALAATLAVVGGVTAAVVSSGPAGRPSAGGSPGGTTHGGAPSSGSASPGNGRHGAAPAGRSTRIFVTGRVSALTAASVTIASGGPPVRAAVTPSTLFTGRVSGLAGVRVGDQVAATITVRTGRATATRLRDPAALPSGGNIP